MVPKSIFGCDVFNMLEFLVVIHTESLFALVISELFWPDNRLLEIHFSNCMCKLFRRRALLVDWLLIQFLGRALFSRIKVFLNKGIRLIVVVVLLFKCCGLGIYPQI